MRHRHLRRPGSLLLLALVGVLIGTLPGWALAQEATGEPGEGIGVVATGLANPRGLAWDADGVLHVAQSGTGETATSVGAAASVVKIVDGCPVEVASGLPSSEDPFRDVLGPEDLTYLDGQFYVLQGATGLLEEMDPSTPNGIYAVEADGSLRLVANLTEWILANEVAHVPGDANDLGEPFRILAGDGGFWVLEANRGEVLWVTTDGAIRRVADLSEGHHVLTGFALAPDGVYVGDLTPSPHYDGTAKVIQVTADGQVRDVWTGLTTVVGIVVGADDTLYALEMATGNTVEPPGMRPGTGRVVRQSGPDSAEPVVTGLDFPIAMEMGPDGALYVAFPAYGENNLAGAVIRIDLSQPQPMTMDGSLVAGARCPGATPYVPPTPGPPATPSTPPPATTPATGTPAATDGDVPADAVVIEIRDFLFHPQTLEVPVGTTVTWTNHDAAPHTATALDGAFDSGNLNQGQSYSHTFDTAGSFDYVCLYHPNMTGTIVVTE